MDNNAVIKKLLEHDQKLELLATKEEVKNFRDEVITGLDKAMVILQRLDQERVFTNEAIKRLQAQQDKQQAEINQIKQVLKIA